MSKKLNMTARPLGTPKGTDAESWVNSGTDKKLAPAPGERKRLTIDLPEQTHAEFKSLCARRGLSMVDEVRAFIDRRIQELQGETRK